MTAKEMYMSEKIMRDLNNPLLKQMIINLMGKFAEMKCKEQKELCAKHFRKQLDMDSGKNYAFEEELIDLIINTEQPKIFEEKSK